MAVTQNGNHTHLTLSDRIYIEQALERRMTFKDSAVFIGKDPFTISKEVRRHQSPKETERKTALCELRDSCTKKHICNDRYCNRLCGKCTRRRCHNSCSDYQSPMCRRLETAPYVCNGCGIRSCRQSLKYDYRAQVADNAYRETLSAARKGVNKTALELDDLDCVISPLLKQGQPLNHIFANHGSDLGCSRRTIYHYLEQGVFSAGPLDLPRQVRYKPRKVRKLAERPIPSYRADRTYKGIFYCDPMASWQKGRLEKNHEFFRYILPKGRPFDGLTKGQVTRIMNHINGTARASLNGTTPFELALLPLPPALLAWVGAVAVPHDDVLLKPRLCGF